MPTDHIITLLITERDKLNLAIEALQGSAKRRGRPSRSPVASAPAASTRKKRTFTAAQRKQQAEKMRAYWAAKRKGK